MMDRTADWWLTAQEAVDYGFMGCGTEMMFSRALRLLPSAFFNI